MLSIWKEYLKEVRDLISRPTFCEYRSHSLKINRHEHLRRGHTFRWAVYPTDLKSRFYLMDGSLPAGKLPADWLCLSLLLLFQCKLWEWSVSITSVSHLNQFIHLNSAHFGVKWRMYPTELHWQLLNVTSIFFCDYVLLPLVPSSSFNNLYYQLPVLGNLQGMVLKNRKIHKWKTSQSWCNNSQLLPP